MMTACFPAVARGLITDLVGHVLIVKPARPGKLWYLPGGTVEAGESPRAACARELAEEIGIEVPVGDLLVAAWNPSRSPNRPGRLSYLFDCGTYNGVSFGHRVVLQRSELSQWNWATVDEAVAVLHPVLAQRLQAARDGVRYLEHGACATSRSGTDSAASCSGTVMSSSSARAMTGP
jgi:8-oxo-dGTP diphosphatase